MTGDYPSDRQANANGARPVPRSPSIPPLRYPDPVQAIAEPPEHSVAPADAVPADAAPTQPASAKASRRLIWLPSSWQFWGLALVLAFSGIGVVSAILLLRLPATPNCPAIFLPTASASLRLYCAQTLADQRTVDSLLRAIDLVNSLPADHPLRPEINREIEEWAKGILALGETTFQQGKLKEAIDIANRIPSHTAAHQTVDKQIQTWKSVWASAEGIYKKAEDALRQQDLRQAFRIATQLLAVNNTYWQSTKYQELNTLITVTREDSNKLDKAKALMEQGGLNNLLAAVKLIGDIKPNSYLYGKAQTTIGDIGRSMMELADAAMERRDYSQATSIIQQIPDGAGLKEEIKDFNTLAQAQAQAWGGTVDDINSAIAQAKRLPIERPLYGKAQQLIDDWQLEIGDVKHLTLAQQLAQPGAIADLNAAIAEARQIPAGNPRADEAQKAIDQWTAQIQTVEDRPLLDQAEQLAKVGNIASLQAAIDALHRISSGRALSGEANQHIQEWTAQIQTTQDQPLLDQARQTAAQGDLADAIRIAQQIGEGRSLYNDAQTDIRNWNSHLEQTQDGPYLAPARQLAAQGDYTGAIATAQQVGAGRSLYSDAQSAIRDWQNQSQGQSRLQQASDAAALGTPAMLRSAIAIADQIPADSHDRAAADRLIAKSSQDLLQIARAKATSDIAAAITIAQSIPANTAAYADAQQQIQVWQQALERH